METHSWLVRQHLTGPSRQSLSRIMSRQTQCTGLTRACPGRRACGAVQVRPAVPAHEAGGAHAAAHSTDPSVHQQRPQVHAAHTFLQPVLVSQPCVRLTAANLVSRQAARMPTDIPSALPGCIVEATLVLSLGAFRQRSACHTEPRHALLQCLLKCYCDAAACL